MTTTLGYEDDLASIIRVQPVDRAPSGTHVASAAAQASRASRNKLPDRAPRANQVASASVPPQDDLAYAQDLSSASAAWQEGNRSSAAAPAPAPGADGGRNSSSSFDMMMDIETTIGDAVQHDLQGLLDLPLSPMGAHHRRSSDQSDLFDPTQTRILRGDEVFEAGALSVSACSPPSERDPLRKTSLDPDTALYAAIQDALQQPEPAPEVEVRTETTHIRTSEVPIDDIKIEPLKMFNLAELVLGVRCALGVPSIRSDGVCVTGTDVGGGMEAASGAAASAQRYLIVAALDLDALDEPGDASTTEGFVSRTWKLPINGAYKHSAWVGVGQSPGHIVFAVSAALHILAVPANPLDAEAEAWRHDSVSVDHADEIREIAANPAMPELVATAGSDGTVLIHNLEASRHAIRAPPTCLNIDGTVGSVRWQPSNPVVVSYTTDEGRLQLFDTRTRNVTQSWQVAAELTGDLYTHAHYDDNTVLLGYSDGGVAFFDMRKGRRTRLYTDASVPAIGDIVFNTDRSMWSVFGQDQFTMWSKRDALHGAGKVYRGRDSVGAEPQPMASPQICVSTTGSFFGSRLAVTNSLGTIAFYDQPPPYALP